MHSLSTLSPTKIGLALVASVIITACADKPGSEGWCQATVSYTHLTLPTILRV